MLRIKPQADYRSIFYEYLCEGSMYSIIQLMLLVFCVVEILSML